MVRSVFFSFHYQRDIMRVQVVKNHYIAKGNYTAAGFFDGSLEEKSQKEGDASVKRLIDNGLKGTSVTCVLIGHETYKRRWVDYEILKSVEMGHGVFGIRIHQIKDFRTGAGDGWGANPFSYLGYGTKGSLLRPMIKYTEGWQEAPHLLSISRDSAHYLPATGAPVLDSVFNVYDWVTDDGYNHFADWVELAAWQAGR